MLAFYAIAAPPQIPLWQMYALFALYCMVSGGIFYLFESFFSLSSNTITALFGATALNLYYWFNAPVIGQLLQTPAPDWFVWGFRVVILDLTLVWIYRTWQKEVRYVAQTVTLEATRAALQESFILEPTGAAPKSAGGTPEADNPEVIVEPAGKRITTTKNRNLLAIIESNDLPIEAGCRMGVCGADPICVLEGMENLSPISSEERATLERLGLADTTRMACMARVRGNCKIALTPEKPKVFMTSIIEGYKYDQAIKKVVIVGNGIAGVTAADHVRRRHPHCEIHLIGRERHHLYNRMGITRLIYGRSAMQGLYLLPEKWYDDFGITCWLNTRVTTINAAAHEVSLGTGEKLAYDRLILTTGSESFVPPIEGFDRPGAFVLRAAEDAMAIRDFAQEYSCQRAVVAGGGLLGLEAAYGLHKLGLQVAVLERSDALLPRQLDARGGQHLRQHLETMGIRILTNAEAVSLQPSAGAESTAAESSAVDRVTQVTLKDDRTLPCAIFVVCAGIQSNTDLAQCANLKINQGVVVDAHMRTSDPHIFAAGDVAEYNGKQLGLWPIAVSQAEVAAASVIAADGQGEKAYAEIVPVTMLKVVGIDLTSIGRIHAAGPGETAIILEDAAAHRYRKLVVADGKIVGAILLGYPTEAPGVAEAVKRAIDVSAHLNTLKAGDWQWLIALTE